MKPDAGAPSKHSRLRTGLAAAMGFGPRVDTAAAHVDRGTLLAVERSYLAADRTLMAWIRTSLSMISFGFTIGKLGQTVAAIEVPSILQGVRMMSV